MMTKNIPQMQPWFGQEERVAINEYMAQGGWITEFRKNQEFERAIESYTGAKHAITVNNGTVSLTVAALALGIGPGDEVIVPNYTMIATPNSVRILGAIPVFVDVEPTRLCIDLEAVERAVTSKTKAVMLVSANGRYPVEGIAAFEEFSERTGIPIIEDSAQSLGSFFPDGRHIGLAGAIGSFSFSAPKVISTGQGGALITNNDDLATSIRKIKDFGRSGGGNDIHDSFGINLKFTDLQAVIGIEQMKKLSWRVERKKEIYRLLKAGLADVSQVRFFDQDLENTSPWFNDVLVEDREPLIEHLKANKIGARVMYPPINKQATYQLAGDHVNSNLIGEKGLWLPSASQLTDEEIATVCDGIRSFYNR